MIEDNSANSNIFCGSNIYYQERSSIDNINEIINSNIEPINNNYNDSHYFCTNCYKFPFIKFKKDRKHIRVTCSCFINKKILIKEFLKKNNIASSLSIFLSKANLNINNENELRCKEHNKEFKGFSKFFLNNYCEDCNYYKSKKSDTDIIRFEDIKIEEKKIDKLINIINDNYDTSESIIKYEIINDSTIEKLEEEEEKKFKKLIDIIINDYKNYPNYIHFFNIKNLLYFFDIEDNPLEKKEDIIIDNIIEENEPIIIEYINNISNKTKLFSKIFVKNKKKKFKIEIEGKRLELIEYYKFKAKEKIVRVKLFINKNVSEINMYKMFSNCTNLVYVNGISKLNNISNIKKLFYNCISLSSIPDFNDWKIQKFNAYLMFHNCISFIFLPYEKNLKINKYDEGFLGILINKYLKYNKDIIISNIIEDNEGYIDLFKNRFKIKNKENKITILDGKDDEREFISCFNYDKKGEENEFIILYKNENNYGNGIKIKLRIINKMKDMNDIIKRKELKKWNINNVKNLGRLFYGCKSLSSLPDDISKWNIKNVTSINHLFYGCESIKFLPNISNWNTKNVTNMESVFNNCKSLLSLPDISKWDTNNANNMKALFFGCKSLSSLPDINMEYK